MQLSAFLRGFLPHPNQVSIGEKFRSGLAGGAAIVVAASVLRYLPHDSLPLPLLASMAAAAVLLFAAPHSPMAHPWNLVGGNLISAIIGWTCGLVIENPILAAGIAVGGAIFAMSLLNCLHPPGAATALVLVLGAAQFHSMPWSWVAWIVVVNVGCFLFLALLFNNVMPKRHYPMLAPTAKAHTDSTVGLAQGDLEWALRQMDGLIDIDIGDLVEIYDKALEHARRGPRISSSAVAQAVRTHRAETTEMASNGAVEPRAGAQS